MWCLNQTFFLESIWGEPTRCQGWARLWRPVGSPRMDSKPRLFIPSGLNTNLSCKLSPIIGTSALGVPPSRIAQGNHSHCNALSSVVRYPLVCELVSRCSALCHTTIRPTRGPEPPGHDVFPVNSTMQPRLTLRPVFVPVSVSVSVPASVPAPVSVTVPVAIFVELMCLTPFWFKKHQVCFLTSRP